MSKPVFFYELCRLCLENAGVCNVLESSNLLEDIYECTGVKVLSSDNLPHTICAKCSAVVQEAKELRTLAKKNDAHLRCLFDMNCCDEITKKDEGINDISNLEKVCGQGTGNYKNANKETNAAMKPKIGKDCSEDNGVDGSPTKKMGRPIKKMGRPIKKMGSPIKNMGSPTKKIKPEERYTKLLETKVKAEHQPKKLKTEDDMIVEFVCGICLKDFSNQKKFYLHQRLHNKKCVCPFDACGKKFATKGDLAKHTRIHTGERPYKCHICTKSFNQKVTLSNHMKSVHPKDTEEDGD